MIFCVICLFDLSHEDSESNQSCVCIPSCGHVFHLSCIQRWFETNSPKTCPKCRSTLPDSTELIKLYFGTNENSKIVDKYLTENRNCRKKIDLLLREVNENLKTIDKNTEEIMSILKPDENPDSGDAFPKLKCLSVLLSRSDEHKRIQEYFDSINPSN